MEWKIRKIRGLIFDFHLKTANYYEGNENIIEENDKEDLADWDAMGVWKNYGRCIMSSTFWGNEGVSVGSEENKLDFYRKE